MNPVEAVLVATLAVGAFYAYRVAMAVRDSAVWFFRRVVLAFLAGVLIFALLNSSGQPRLNSEAAGTAAGLLVLVTGRKRTRRISARVKRRVIERDLGGAKYDPTLQHIDHVWPHSRGGGNTEENLRVIPKKKNLRKGAKLPGPLDWR